MRRVAFGIATDAALPDSLQPQASSSGGTGTSGTVNVSDGCLAGPSTAPMSDPGEEQPIAVSSPRADPVSPQPVPSTSRGTGVERIFVDPSTGARNKLTGHRSGGGFRIYDEEELPSLNTDNTYAAGEGGYSDEEDEDAEEEDQGANDQDDE